MKFRPFLSTRAPLFLGMLAVFALAGSQPVFAAPSADPLSSSGDADDSGLGLDEENGEENAAQDKTPVPASTLPADSAPPLIENFYKVLDQAQAASTINQRLSILAPSIQKVFDLDGILSRSVGRSFATLSPADSKLLKDAFYRYTLSHYASIFKPGTSAVFSVNPEPKRLADGNVVIRTHIAGENDTTGGTSIDYVMKSEQNEWKIIDVLLDGHISQVAAQRSDFRTPFRDGGAQGLAQLLEGKTQTALQGS